MPILSQFCTNAIIASASILLGAIGFSLIYSVQKFFDFTYALSFAFASYCILLFISVFRIPLAFGIIATFIVLFIVGGGLSGVLFGKLRMRDASNNVLFLISVGLYIVVQNCISLFFGDESKRFSITGLNSTVQILSAYITMTQILTVLVSVSVCAVLFFGFHITAFGLTVRAIASSHDLAIVYGVNVGRSAAIAGGFAWMIGGAGGILMGLDVGLVPTMGMNPLLLAIVTVICSWSFGLSALAITALFLGLLFQISGYLFGAQWQEPMAFVALVVALLFRRGRKM